MARLHTSLVVALSLAPLAGQGSPAPRIDGADPTAYFRTLAAVRAALTPADLESFQDAVGIVTMLEMRAATKAGTPDGWEAALMRALHGKTATEVIRLGAKLRAANVELVCDASEKWAALMLSVICNKQRLLQLSGKIDVDGDGRGEAGYFAELSGAVGVRDGRGQASGPKLQLRADEWQPVANGRVTRTRQGYVFQMYLPGKDGAPLAEAATGGAGRPAPEPDQAETSWCVYAWPIEYGRTGKRAFFICQDGTVLATDNLQKRYSGHGNAPEAGAAYPAGRRGLSPGPGEGGAGQDGQQWQPPDPRSDAPPTPGAHR